jgi:hypothetical protein
MAKWFNVTLAQGMSNVKLDSMGRASVQYTAKNVSAAPVDGRAVLVSLPHTNPPAGVVEKGWVKIDGSEQRHFDKDREEVFVAKIAVPPKSPPGDYTFRLDVVSVAKPDEGDSAPAVAFKVSEEAITKGGGSKWLLIVLVIVIVLAVGGAAAWLLTRKSSPKSAPTPTPNQSALASTWLNDNSNTNSLTRLIITQDGSGVSVHAFGRCSPTDCDWGVQRGNTTGNNAAVILWDQGFVVRTMSLQVTSPGHLTSRLDSVYRDNRARQLLVEAFHNH